MTEETIKIKTLISEVYKLEPGGSNSKAIKNDLNGVVKKMNGIVT